MERNNKKVVRNFLLTAMCLFASWACLALPENDRVLVAVKRTYKAPNTENAKLFLDWAELVKRLPSLKNSNLKVTDQHFDQPVPFEILDENGDGKADKIALDFTFRSNEPVFALMVSAGGKGADIKKSEPSAPDPKWEVSYQVPFKVDPKAAAPQKTIAERITESTLHAYPDTKDLSIISPGKWTYEYGFFLNAVFKLYERTRNEQYLAYCKNWVDNFVTPEGQWKEGVYNMKEYRLDDVLPGRLCIYLYQQTGDSKYKKIADQLIVQLTQQPKTSDGGYWHKEIYPNQMWLDGIYMGDVFSMQYASAFNESRWYDEAAAQIKLIYKHTYDPVTGLLFHGWDESKNKVWADQEKGTSPERWSRAIGWFAMALVECLDYLPADHPERRNIQSIFQKLCASIKKYQDKKTGLWFQVADKGNMPDNWIETSSSAMFVFAFAKGVNKKLLDKSFSPAAEKGYDALVNNYLYSDDHGDIHLDQAVKVGSLNIRNSKGDYPYYISGERRLDDYKGLAALLYASIELNK